MRVARDIVIGKLLQHKTAFYPLLDYIDRHHGACEVPQALYLREYRQRILPLDDDQAVRLLTLESLHENGLFFHLDNQAGTATLHSWLVDMLRFTDTSRMRELSNADFENLRAQFQLAAQRFDELAIAAADADYQEARIALFDLIDSTLSRIQRNVEALDANANRLGEDFERLDALGHSGADSRELLERAAALYERFIKPCAEFLSPGPGLKHERKSFTEAMEQLAERHETAGAGDVACRLLFKLTAIRSYYKDIAGIERQVQRYCRSLEQERRRYRAIEAAHNALLDAVVALRHGKLRHTQLPAGHPVFAASTTFAALHTHGGRHAKKLDWYDAPNRIWLEEWVASLSERPVEGAAALQPVSVQADGVRERREAITRLCVARTLHAPCEDIVDDFHRWLPTVLADYALPDLVVAYQTVMGLARYRTRLRWTRRKRRVDDGHYYFDYLIAAIGADAAEAVAR